VQCGFVQEIVVPEVIPKRAPNRMLISEGVALRHALLKILPHLQGTLGLLGAEIMVHVSMVRYGNNNAAHDLNRLAFWGACSCFVLFRGQGDASALEVSLHGITSESLYMTRGQLTSQAQRLCGVNC
jgi:hypothetical protein